MPESNSGHEDIRCLVTNAPGLQSVYRIEHQFAGEKVLFYHLLGASSGPEHVFAGRPASRQC